MSNCRQCGDEHRDPPKPKPLPTPKTCPVCEGPLRARKQIVEHVFRSGPATSKRRVFVCTSCKIGVRVQRYPRHMH